MRHDSKRNVDKKALDIDKDIVELLRMRWLTYSGRVISMPAERFSILHCVDAPLDYELEEDPERNGLCVSKTDVAKRKLRDSWAAGARRHASSSSHRGIKSH